MLNEFEKTYKNNLYIFLSLLSFLILFSLLQNKKMGDFLVIFYLNHFFFSCSI